MNITLHDKSLEIRLTRAAQKALALRETPLVAEMELLFSCLHRKRVYFGESAEQSTAVNAQLAVRFKPIMTRRCRVAEGGAARMLHVDPNSGKVTLKFKLPGFGSSAPN